MKQKHYRLPIDTPAGTIELEVSHRIVREGEEDMRVTLSATLQGKRVTYRSDSTEGALLLLAKSLPENWHVRSCLSCRFGHFCPVGDQDNELFCVTDFDPKSPSDLWDVTEDDLERKNRSRTLFACCKHYKEQSADYFTYSDYLSRVKSKE